MIVCTEWVWALIWTDCRAREVGSTAEWVAPKVRRGHLTRKISHKKLPTNKRMNICIFGMVSWGRHLDSDNFKSAAKSKTHHFGEIEVNAIREENAPRRKTKQKLQLSHLNPVSVGCFPRRALFFVSSAPKLSNKLDNKLQSAGGLETRNATNISFIIESTLTFLTLNFNLDSAPETFSGMVYNNRFQCWQQCHKLSASPLNEHQQKLASVSTVQRDMPPLSYIFEIIICT